MHTGRMNEFNTAYFFFRNYSKNVFTDISHGSEEILISVFAVFEQKM
jgi:hypothetical protein